MTSKRLLALGFGVAAVITLFVVRSQKEGKPARPASANVSENESSPIAQSTKAARPSAARGVFTSAPLAPRPSEEHVASEEPRDPTVRAAAERKEWMANLESSGSSSEPWTRDALHALDTARKGFAAHDARVGAPQCWGKGCSVEVSFPSMQAYWSARQDVFEPLAGEYPSGVRIITGPEVQANNEVQSHLILSRPE